MARNKLETVEILRKSEKDLLNEWVKSQLRLTQTHKAQLKEEELREQCREFLQLLIDVFQQYASATPEEAASSQIREFLTGISKSRTAKGFSASETATFVFSLKRPLFGLVREQGNDPEATLNELMSISELLDSLGLWTTEVYQRAREDLINRQQQDMLELSTPVVKLWDGVLALPLIGTLDSARTQVVMEALLQKILETGSSVAIIDITGVPTVDTLVAQHLLKTVTAARLMGADCIISGIRPQIAQTIVHLGVALNNVTTKSSLADAFEVALARLNMKVTRKITEANGRP